MTATWNLAGPLRRRIELTDASKGTGEQSWRSAGEDRIECLVRMRFHAAVRCSLLPDQMR